MMEALAQWGVPGLFISAFLAATILPLSSELVLSALLLSGQPPTTLVLAATTGNVLGSLTNYALGLWAARPVVQKWLRMSDASFERAEVRFRKYGLLSLCFAWVPVVGDPLTVIAGALRVPISGFLILVTAGKFARYVVVAYLVLSA
ncbi:YqaA family protein [Alteromonas antoniana]|uniref:YqaA family protein n=1 Tax=Alteromonas antoniana TaxID=2803813 RepID=UPI001FE9501C|nr:YqaA family protein [Alteromonas antoniana]